MSALIEVAIPALNEASTIGKVIRDFQQALPDAQIVVYDNGSTDATGELAIRAGAYVRKVPRKGKGFVVQHIFESSQADAVLLVDGDDTYEAQDAQRLLEPILSQDADMVMGRRIEDSQIPYRRPLRWWGNRILTKIFNAIFRGSFRDILSGYRCFSRRFLEEVPLVTSGFEIETELLLQALELGMVVQEVSIRFRNRPPGSQSKLQAFTDGYRIFMTMLILLRDHRPLFVFGICSGALGLLAMTRGQNGILLWQVSLVLLLVGLVLNTVNTRFREIQSLLRRPRRAKGKGSPVTKLEDSECQPSFQR